MINKIEQLVGLKASHDSPGSLIDERLRSLQGAAERWRQFDGRQRAAVARACRAQFRTLDMSWVAEDLRCVGIEPSKPEFYNSISFVPFVFVSIVCERLDNIVKALEGTLSVPEPERQAAEGGALVYRMGDVGASAAGAKVEVWAEGISGRTSAQAEPTVGATVVLGAGNQNFLTAVDVIERAFLHKECVLLKHHPIRPFMSEPFAHIFAPLADVGAYAQCLDSDVNGHHAALVSHPAVGHIHMTGSGATHDRIVAALKSAGRETVGFTSELGCVTPWIVCPGASTGVWEESEIAHHAQMLTSAFKSACSMNCLSPKLLVLPSERIWPQRSQFLQALRDRLASCPQLPPYYPGAHQRFAAFAAAYSDAERVEAPPAQNLEPTDPPLPKRPGQDFTPLPSLLIDVGTLGSSSCRDYALENEAFAPVLAIGTVDCATAADFPLAAARAVNKHVFGTLSCTVIWRGARDEALDATIRELRYGCVAVNMWAAIGYGNPLGVWGGAPGTYSRESPQSGLDFVGNAAGIPNATKGVLISPFVNKGVSLAKPPPTVVIDALLAVQSGQGACRALRIVLGRCCGLLPRRLPGRAREAAEPLL